MAKSKGGQRARRQARQAKRARAEQQLANVAAAQGSAEGSKKTAVRKQPKAQAPKAQTSDKPGAGKRLGNYLREVKTELRRVVWPSPRELRNYSIAVICLLIVFGIAVWLVDSGVVAVLIGYSGLRG